jgi:thioredoxin 1
MGRMVKVIEEVSQIPMEGKVVIDFFATWCGPCKHIAPKFEELSKIYTSVQFLKVDVDESAELTEQFDVRAMPTFVFLVNGQIVRKIEGADLRGIGETLEQMMK